MLCLLTLVLYFEEEIRNDSKILLLNCGEIFKQANQSIIYVGNYSRTLSQENCVPYYELTNSELQFQTETEADSFTCVQHRIG